MAKQPPAARAARSDLDEQLRVFAHKYFDLELSEAQRAELALHLIAPDAHARAQTSAAAGGRRGQAGDAIDEERQRIQAVIKQSLGRAQAALISNAQAERAAESAVLGALERTDSLEGLRPKDLPPGTQPPLISQIAGRLTELIKAEVDACFQQQFGPLALQLQAVIDTAQAKGLLPKKDEDDAAGDASKSGKTTEKPAAAAAAGEARDKSAKTSAPASQRD
ncbi:MULTISPECIES: hypothetical protein [unclassified Lysobacter]|uniref:hypothetical protein n=1 Tax=unclassified Lysobacter TaxID=2635362 RepID=UPI001BE714B7|nr:MULTISPECIES: hypothetical protein [unclassified Lysobacter]MBT2748494.1 hypothetical protein [Lysobacter sp. ISL-42]MBT2752576.1 hypothetical protein [Lysobacter sp. ISL-50]MBT2776695.1 hypothetical protein [Lysobacter sp. ISL-54]MBT2782566.1 hypothetical protein [Lysobacter sp. ISL-52]